jgi:hypothetical protein
MRQTLPSTRKSSYISVMYDNCQEDEELLRDTDDNYQPTFEDDIELEGAKHVKIRLRELR